MNWIDFISCEDFRRRVRKACYVYIYCIALAFLIGLVITLFSSCGTSGEIGNGNTTNVYINSSVSESSSISLISDDYDIQSIESQNDGNIIIVTLIKKSL